MNANKKTARVAGVLYLTIIIAGILLCPEMPPPQPIILWLLRGYSASVLPAISS